MKKSLKKLVSCVMTMALATTAITVPPNTDTAKAASVTSLTTSPARVSVHDPSITEAVDGYYYAFGSHIDAAKSKDLVNWTTFSNNYTTKNNVIFGDLDENLKKPFEWAGKAGDTDDGRYHVWAPDVFWNKDYINADGSTGAYMMYFCCTSTWSRSVIAYGVSQNIEGPYDVVDTIVYSAFDNVASGKLSYKNTNIDELIAAGKLDGLHKEWFDGTSYNFRYGPNAIDPTVFYDKEGKLWMTYGSFSGGIYILEIDPETGAAIYPGKTSTTADGRAVDAYFGTHLGGKNHWSTGEGPYILYDKESDYYYLYVSYDGLDVDGGYHMRMYRSKSPDGPYLDAAGNNYEDVQLTSRLTFGIKVMGNYKFSSNPNGYKAPGHNSALIDDDGNRYLIYHTRFENRGGIHEVRVHQQFINEAGWPVTAVFENKGDEISKTGYDKDSIVGEYEYINHGINADYTNVKKPQNITLNADGTISGAIKGTWTEKDGSYLMTAVIDDVTYSGVFFQQHDESEACKKRMTFTAIGTNNETIWGVRKEAYKYTDKEALDRATNNLENDVIITSKTTSDLTLPTSGFENTKIAWTSSNADIISNSGKVTRPAEDTEVTLTAVLTTGSESATREYKTTVLSSSLKPDYRYDFENVTDKKAASTGTNTAEAVLQGSASITSDTFAGNVLTIKNSSGTNGKNYLALPSDVFKNIGDSGFTVSMWAKCSSSTMENSVLFEAKTTNTTNMVPATALFVGGYAGVRDTAYSTGTPEGLAPDSNTWHLITYTVSPAGITVYINGESRSTDTRSLASVLTAENMAKINDVRIGSGTLFSSQDVANASIDNIDIYSVPLSANEVAAKYQAEKGSYPNFSCSASRSTIYCGGDTNNTSKITVSGSADFTYTTTFSSSDSSVASVDTSGTVTARKAGTATITATLTGSDNKTQAFTKKITVKKAYVTISKKKTSIKVKKSFTFKAKGYGFKASSITWSSSKPSVLSINKKSGKATAKKAGTATITAKCKSSKATVKVKVKKK